MQEKRAKNVISRNSNKGPNGKYNERRGTGRSWSSEKPYNNSGEGKTTPAIDPWEFEKGKIVL